MAATTLPVVHAFGTLRSVADAITNKNGTREVYGQRVTVLTEPDGGFLDVIAFPDQADKAALEGFIGSAVALTVTVSPRPGDKRAFLSVTLLSIDAWDGVLASEPVPA